MTARIRRPLAACALGLGSLLTVSAISTVPAAPPAPRTQFTFRDVGDEAGLYPALAGIAGHAAAWGDVDGDGWPDLFVGTFGGKPYDSKPSQLFRNVKGKFTLDPQKQLRIEGRGNGAVFADLTNSGRLDLFYTNHAIDGKPYKMPHFAAPNRFVPQRWQGQVHRRLARLGGVPDGLSGAGVCACWTAPATGCR